MTLEHAPAYVGEASRIASAARILLRRPLKPSSSSMHLPSPRISQVRQTLQLEKPNSYRCTSSNSTPSFSNSSCISFRILVVVPIGRGLPFRASTFMGRS